MSQQPSPADWPTLLGPALDEVSNGVTVVATQQQEQPLVFVNRTFERITGYSSAECIGRNCRFLQGPDTDPEAVDTLRQAVRRGEACHIVLRNYRKDGTAFLNELKLLPLATEQDAGRPEYFIGIQNDVTAQFVALALQRRVRRPRELLAKIRAARSPQLEVQLDFDDLPLAGDDVGVLIASPRGEILHHDDGADALLTGSPVKTIGASLLDVFELPEETSLVETLYSTRQGATPWLPAWVRDDTRSEARLRFHRADLDSFEQHMMVVLVRSAASA